jgi:hypothetical protein
MDAVPGIVVHASGVRAAKKRIIPEIACTVAVMLERVGAGC